MKLCRDFNINDEYVTDFSSSNYIVYFVIHLLSKNVSVEANGCEQLAQSHYAAAPWPWIKLMTSWSQVRRPAIAPPCHAVKWSDFRIFKGVTQMWFVLMMMQIYPCGWHTQHSESCLSSGLVWVLLHRPALYTWQRHHWYVDDQFTHTHSLSTVPFSTEECLSGCMIIKSCKGSSNWDHLVMKMYVNLTFKKLHFVAFCQTVMCCWLFYRDATLSWKSLKRYTFLGPGIILENGIGPS